MVRAGAGAVNLVAVEQSDHRCICEPACSDPSQCGCPRLCEQSRNASLRCPAALVTVGTPDRADVLLQLLAPSVRAHDPEAQPHVPPQHQEVSFSQMEPGGTQDADHIFGLLHVRRHGFLTPHRVDDRSDHRVHDHDERRSVMVVPGAENEMSAGKASGPGCDAPSSCSLGHASASHAVEPLEASRPLRNSAPSRQNSAPHCSAIQLDRGHLDETASTEPIDSTSSEEDVASVTVPLPDDIDSPLLSEHQDGTDATLRRSNARVFIDRDTVGDHDATDVSDLGNNIDQLFLFSRSVMNSTRVKMF